MRPEYRSSHLKIVTYPSEVLARQARKITDFDGNLRETAREMFQTMYASNGIGLAAPQVGLSVRLCVVNWPESEVGEVAMVNPELIEQRGRQAGEEGCLSFPGIFIKVQRSAWVKVRYQDLDGNEQILEVEGLAARAVQHELDHLDGVLLVNKMTTIQRMANRWALEMLRRRLWPGEEGEAVPAGETAPDQEHEAGEPE
ncbi:MAG: peptide deformylase [Anaerolineaceae bacterium]|nr:peptide deformylase [Anaerolineaceae bacterium]